MASIIIGDDPETTTMTANNGAMKPSRRKVRQQQSRQLRTPPTSAEIALSYEKQHVFRKAQMKSMYIGMLMTLMVGAICTFAAHSYSRRLTLEARERYRVVVSLGTTPSTLSSMQPLLESLIEKQDMNLRMVYLVLPERQLSGDKIHFDIPTFVTNYVDQKKLYLLTPDFDYGSISKVIYSIEMESFDTRIICMDDTSGEAVKPDFVSTFLEQSLHYPESAIAFSGATLHNYFRPTVDKASLLLKNPLVFQGTRLATTVDVLQGPVMVQRRFFDVEAFTETINDSRESVRAAGDFLLAAYLELQKVERRVVPRSRKGPILEPNGAGGLVHVEAAYYLQQQLGIWKSFKFHNPIKLSDKEKDAINCDGGDDDSCNSGYKKLLQQLDSRSS